ncbi:MAG TPA: RNA polymerase sigma factor [Vulgatibacter sp.]|nr:RNA polymerase sigma factor [Vulgatibacter sp.]
MIEAAGRLKTFSRATDEEIVARVLSGEVAAFELLVRRHNQVVYRTVRSILRDDAEAEDVMQHAHVAAFQHLSQFRGGSKYSTWLVRIAVHEAKARLRRQGRLVELVEADVDGSMGTWNMRVTRDPEKETGSRQLGRILEELIDGLPAHHRAVFVLREVEGLSTAEVAHALDLSEDNVKTRLHRAKAALRDRLTERLGAAAVEVWRFDAPRCDRVWSGVLAEIAG